MDKKRWADPGVDAVRCAIEVQSSLIELNTVVPEDMRIEFRVGIQRV
jgi:hypothetical protein